MIASKEEVDFGSGVDSKSSITVSLVNAGDAAMVIEDIRLSGKDSGLTVEEQGCMPGMMLEPVQACPLTLSWSPVREGGLLDDVQILHDGARGILVLPVRGEADAAVSQDSQAIYLSDSPGMSLDVDDLALDASALGGTGDFDLSGGAGGANKSRSLDGFVITSFSRNRAIIAGPSGSRVVSDGEDIVVGGVMWRVVMRKSGIEFRSGMDKVLLLFDRSLSSISRVSGQSSSGGGRAGATPSVTSVSEGTDAVADF
jgi:hypothetical protein